VGSLVGAGTLIASRVSLAGDQGGIGDTTIGLPALLLFLVGFVRAGLRRSFRVGLEGALLSLGTALVGMVAVGVVESWRWYQAPGAYLWDGDTVKDSTALGASLDFVNPFFMALHLAFWLPAAVLGAAAGARAQRVRGRPPTPFASS
jgi:hypothetical protein